MTQPDTRTRTIRREFIIYLYPPILIIGAYLLFQWLEKAGADRQGYPLGMTLYWLLGCIIPFLLWTGRPARVELLRFGRLRGWMVPLLLIPIIITFFTGPFTTGPAGSAAPVIVLSVFYSLVNACSEELLWRTVYFDHHRGHFFHAVIVPSIWYGTWYYVPLSVQNGQTGNLIIILAATASGFCWATVTYYTKSVYWSLVSHLLTSITGLGIYYF